jgi:superfamily II DNA or RNA helicase
MELPVHRTKSIEHIVARAVRQRGLILAHMMGTGKTLTALMFLQNFLDCSVVVISPKVIQYVWEEEVHKFGSSGLVLPGRLRYFNYETLLEHYQDIPEGSVLIFDEVHHLEDVFSDVDEARVIVVMKQLRSALKILALTGTMFITEISDIRFAMNLLTPELGAPIPLDKKAFLAKFFSYPEEKRKEYEERIAEQKAIIDFKPGKSKTNIDYRTIFESIGVEVVIGTGIGGATYALTRDIEKSIRASMLSLPISMIFAGKRVQDRFKRIMVPVTKSEYYVLKSKLLQEMLRDYISHYVPSVLDIDKRVRWPTKDFAAMNVYYMSSRYTKEQQVAVWRVAINQLSRTEESLLVTPLHPRGSRNFDRYLDYGIQIGGLQIGAEVPEKYVAILKHIKSTKRPAVVYSQFQPGMDGFARYLSEQGVDFRTVFNEQERSSALKWFSDNKAGLLLLGSKYYEGLSIIGARVLHLMEPIANRATFQQVAGRVRRFRSHVHLPYMKRHVNLIVWRSVPCKNIQKVMNVAFGKYKKMKTIHFNAVFTPDLWTLKQKEVVDTQIKALNINTYNIHGVGSVDVETECCIWRPAGEACPDTKAPCSNMYKEK